MPTRHNKVLHSQARRMVYNVLQYMKKESEEGLQYDVKAVQKRTAAATGVSESTVRKIIKAANDSNSNPERMFRTPGKKRSGKRKVTCIGSTDRGVIRRCVHNFHNTEKELPTINRLLRKLKIDINFNGSAASLRRILKDLGFRWKRTVDKRKVLVEHTNIRLSRIEYLEKITKYRAEGRAIVFTDESYIDTSHIMSDGTIKGTGERIIVIHAGSEAGFVPNALLMFKADTKLGDYHNNINYENYETWIRTQLIPNLPANSVVVIGNVSYHNELEDAALTSKAKKSEMESWLFKKGIPFSSNMFKPELYKLICLIKERIKKYKIDRILKEHNHPTLRFPTHHSDLNPMEMAWASIKADVAKKDISNINILMKHLQEKVNAMDENKWTVFCRIIHNLEEEYKKSDVEIDKLTEDIVTDRTEKESDDDSEKDNSVSSEEETDDSYLDEEFPSTFREEIFIIVDVPPQ